jgi:hypothetical protein
LNYPFIAEKHKGYNGNNNKKGDNDVLFPDGFIKPILYFRPGFTVILSFHVQNVRLISNEINYFTMI